MTGDEAADSGEHAADEMTRAGDSATVATAEEAEEEEPTGEENAETVNDPAALADNADEGEVPTGA
jgi:hypothetical protein